MTNETIARRRLLRQRIAGGKHERPGDAVRQMGAMQAQDYGQALWAVGLRTANATMADVERAIAERQIVLTWALRGTIHMVPPEDAKWMLQISAPRVLAQSRRRREQLGIDDDILMRSRKLAAAALEGGRRATRPAVMRLLEEAGIATANQRGYHILWHIAQEGLICFGPADGRQQTFVLLDEWVPNPRALAREEGLAELAARYMAGHGPATEHDFAWWAGVTLGDAKRALEAVGGGLMSEQAAGRTYWSPRGHAAQSEAAGVHLLPGFDEYLLGYKDRSAVLAPEHAPLIIPGGNGVFMPTVVDDGRTVGIWKRTVKKTALEIAFHPFDGNECRAERFDAAIRRYGEFVGLPVRATGLAGG